MPPFHPSTDLAANHYEALPVFLRTSPYLRKGVVTRRGGRHTLGSTAKRRAVFTTLDVWWATLAARIGNPLTLTTPHALRMSTWKTTTSNPLPSLGIDRAGSAWSKNRGTGF